MRAFITGNRGFIGSHLQEYLLGKGWEVIGVDNLLHPCQKETSFIYGDVRYYQDIEKFVEKSDVVFHLAAQINVDKSIVNVGETIDINIGGTVNVLEACKKFKKKLVFASSSEVYGSSQMEFMDEMHVLDAQSPYAASKVAGDRLCKAYYDTYGLDVAILRNFNTFGDYQSDDSYGGVIAKFTKAALLNETLHIFGDGKQARDYISVKDAIRAYEFCAMNPTAGEVYNVGSGKTITINELADLIIKLTKSKSNIIHEEPRPGEVRRLCADMGKIKKLGFSLEGDFEKDLSEYVKNKQVL
jgi:nucleoside-diphosphate-sugar epimerase